MTPFPALRGTRAPRLRIVDGGHVIKRSAANGSARGARTDAGPAVRRGRQIAAAVRSTGCRRRDSLRMLAAPGGLAAVEDQRGRRPPAASRAISAPRRPAGVCGRRLREKRRTSPLCTPRRSAGCRICALKIQSSGEAPVSVAAISKPTSREAGSDPSHRVTRYPTKAVVTLERFGYRPARPFRAAEESPSSSRAGSRQPPADRRRSACA